MEIRTYFDLIDWSRQRHEKLAKCLAHCATLHEDERSSSLLEYFSSCEAEMEKMVAGFEQQADPKASNTYVYDYVPHKPISTHLVCDDHYARLDARQISAEVFGFHEQIMDLYRSLLDKAEIPEAMELVQSLLDMEENNTRLLARQVGRMDDL